MILDYSITNFGTTFLFYKSKFFKDEFRLEELSSFI